MEIDKDIFGKKYKEMTTEKKDKINKVKSCAEDLLNEILEISGDVSIVSVSITRLEECVMWAVKAITA